MEFEGIYDLFAIRIVLDTPLEKERSDCWLVYSIITDMYQPNPKRLKDWISIPKSNGYESLHITVMGPQNRWVEVQIRTKRMDEIAERGLAAHWKYKGIKAETGLDEFLNNVRAALEAKENNPVDLMNDFKMDLYKDEIYVFTPTGELIKLPKGATVLDFAFAIHSKLGCTCVSAKVNDRNVPIKYVLHNGDTVSVLTSPTQTPKRDWLNIVVTSKARVRIKQALREETVKAVDMAKELLQRRFKNRKVELDEPTLMRYIKRKGFKTVTDFYTEIANERLDPNLRKETETSERTEAPKSAEEYVTTTPVEEISTNKDILVIDQNLTGVEYKLAKCCNPIYGDEVFGFVSSQGIKIHRMDCPNAPGMFSRYGYRVIPAKWSGKGSDGYVVAIRVVGRDDHLRHRQGAERHLAVAPDPVDRWPVSGDLLGHGARYGRAEWLDPQDQGGEWGEGGRATERLGCASPAPGPSGLSRCGILIQCWIFHYPVLDILLSNIGYFIIQRWIRVPHRGAGEGSFPGGLEPHLGRLVEHEGPGCLIFVGDNPVEDSVLDCLLDDTNRLRGGQVENTHDFLARDRRLEVAHPVLFLYVGQFLTYQLEVVEETAYLFRILAGDIGLAQLHQVVDVVASLEEQASDSRVGHLVVREGDRAHMKAYHFLHIFHLLVHGQFHPPENTGDHLFADEVVVVESPAQSRIKALGCRFGDVVQQGAPTQPE